MHSKQPRRRALLVAAATLPLVAAAVAAGAPAQAAGDGPRAALAGTHPAWAKAAADKGQTAAGAEVTARVYLAGRDSAGLAALARSVSDPASASYGHYLTSAQVEQRFGATKQQVAAVRAWLTASGLTVTGADSHSLTVRGTAAAAQRAFAVQLHNFSKDGHTYRAPDREASVPKAVASSVLSVTGLSTAPRKASHDDVLPPPEGAFVNAGPLSAYYGEKTATTLPQYGGNSLPYAVKGYTGKQLRAAYGATATGLTGKGVRVAVVDAYDAPTIASDIATYAARNGDKAYRSGQFVDQPLGNWTHTDTSDTGCGAAGWYGEQSLDIEAVHAMAPDAGITYVGASSCYDDDLIAALNTIVDQRSATIVTNSWGEPELYSDPSLDSVYNQLFQRGALEGIGFYFSSGDNGDEVANTGTKQSDMPASLPWVTAVGGTSLAVGKYGNYEFETGWGTHKYTLAANGNTWNSVGYIYGAGGGTSARSAQPWYQAGIVPRSLSGTTAGAVNRVVPDIAADGDPTTGFLVGQSETWPDGSIAYGEYRIGGTSLASPLIAGLQALAQQAAGRPLGFANPAIYARYGSAAYHDVVDPKGQLGNVRVDFANGLDASAGLKYSVRTFGEDSSLKATTGYDDVTGVGSPTTWYLLSYASGSHH